MVIPGNRTADSSLTPIFQGVLSSRTVYDQDAPRLDSSSSSHGSLIACPECDALHQRVSLSLGEAARCQRCGAVLYRRPRLRNEHVLALVLTALVALAIAHSFPIVALTLSGIPSSTTLIGSIHSLWGEGRPTMAVLVFATALLFPLLDLLSILSLLLSNQIRLLAGWRAPLSRFVRALRPWGMTEVFVLGVLVSLVKLSHIARVVPGVAMWAFAVAAVLLAVIGSFDLRSLWDDET